MWTPAALHSEARPWDAELWRAVESQTKASTMKLTDSLDEQRILENVLERSKPAFPPEFQGFHYLISTPFRYAPYPHGSRFRRKGQRKGAFYCSDQPSTAIAETSFYRLLFLIESPAMILPRTPVEHTVFSVACKTPLALNLCAPPLDADTAAWMHPIDYTRCQDLADLARKAGIGAIRYASVRDPNGGKNAAILSAGAFAEHRPVQLQTWHIFPGKYSVRAWCENPKMELEFRRQDFAHDPRILDPPQPPHRTRRPSRRGQTLASG
jgi:hypothetical protein